MGDTELKGSPMLKSILNQKKINRILLVEAGDQHRWIGSRVNPQVNVPPLGLMYLASYARKIVPELEIKILNTSFQVTSDEEFNRILEEFQPDLVGIRSICLFYKEFKKVADLTKAWKHIPVIGGGPIATTKKGRLLDAIDSVDLLVINEGEITFGRLLTGEPIEDMKGFVYRDGKDIIDTGNPNFVENLDTLPFPDYGLIDFENYENQLSYTYNYRRQGMMLTSRGCPFQCTYCNTFAGKKIRMRSAENVFQEMNRLWETFNVEDFYFVDDIFNINKKRAEELFQRIIDLNRDWKLYFVNGLRADFMTEGLVDLMVEAGTIWLCYAVETACTRVQKLIRKKLDLRKAAQIINYSQEKGVVVNINTMYGFPTETPDEANITLDYIAQLNMPSLLPYHFGLNIFEGCEIVDQAREAGWEVSFHNEDGASAYNTPNAGTPTFSRDAMLDHVIEFHERFGMANKKHLNRSLSILKNVGYSDRDLVDMYSVLFNKPLKLVDEILI